MRTVITRKDDQEDVALAWKACLDLRHWLNNKLSNFKQLIMCSLLLDYKGLAYSNIQWCLWQCRVSEAAPGQELRYVDEHLACNGRTKIQWQNLCLRLTQLHIEGDQGAPLPWTVGLQKLYWPLKYHTPSHLQSTLLYSQRVQPQTSLPYSALQPCIVINIPVRNLTVSSARGTYPMICTLSLSRQQYGSHVQ